MAVLELSGNIRLSEAGQPRRTVGKFAGWMEANASTLQKYFGETLSPGSLNIDVPNPPTLSQDLDAGKYRPSFVIPHAELVEMAPYLNDGQAWRIIRVMSRDLAAAQDWLNAAHEAQKAAKGSGPRAVT